MTILQTIVAVGLIAWGLILAAGRAREFFATGRARERAPVDDLRLVIDLAARLRDAGKTDAVAVCQKLLDELLKPGTPTT